MKIKGVHVQKIRGGGLIPFAKPMVETPCEPGDHVERIYFPEIKSEEWSIRERIKKLQEADNDPFEILAAVHNMQRGHLDHGRQISRNATPAEEMTGKKGDHQHIKAVCVKCGQFREIDHVANDGSIVECKVTDDFVGEDQYKNNLALLERGLRVAYKLPKSMAVRKRGQRFQRLSEIGFELIFV